jgi:hypothetical protein
MPKTKGTVSRKQMIGGRACTPRRLGWVLLNVLTLAGALRTLWERISNATAEIGLTQVLNRSSIKIHLPVCRLQVP